MSLDLNGMSELRLGGAETIKKMQESQLTLQILDKDDPRKECWAELKVRDRFINKRSYHASVIYDSKYLLSELIIN